MVRYYFAQLPIRSFRLLKHFIYPLFPKYSNTFPSKNVVHWVFDFFFYLIDVLAIPELYQALFLIFKPNTRPLSQEEQVLAQSIFHSTLQYDLIRIDDRAKMGTRTLALAYVSFNTINYRKVIKKAIFIHELMHIWQFQHFGSIYIAKAITAQRSKAGYDYGGVENLYRVMLRGGRLLEFNFEQQADIIEDYYLLVKNIHTSPIHYQVYHYFGCQLNEFPGYK